MPNGKPGDHPLTDIIHHNATYFTEEIRQLIKDCYELGSHNIVIFNKIEWFTESEDQIKQRLIDLKKSLQ